mmetsp:Transcript_50053/g.98902  ORF Transcript_50053/g.98902 Transcript_50053/m.98902 type:complete len:105 (-) Transcript_50053:676-990(-)
MASRLSVFNALQLKENSHVARKLLLASLAMAVLPVATFFVVKYVFFGPENDTNQADMVSGFSAVVMANIVIACYVVMAFNEAPLEGDLPPRAPVVGIWATQKTD